MSKKSPKRPKYVVRAPIEIPRTARALIATANMAGITAEARSPRKRLELIVVGGIDVDRGFAFTATWVDGATAGADIYRKRAAYALVEDNRPPHGTRKPDPKHKGRTIPMPGCKPLGLGSHRFVYQGGPTLPHHVGVSALLAELKALE